MFSLKAHAPGLLEETGGQREGCLQESGLRASKVSRPSNTGKGRNPKARDKQNNRQSFSSTGCYWDNSEIQERPRRGSSEARGQVHAFVALFQEIYTVLLTDASSRSGTDS